MVGRTLNHYRILEPLGSGGMGQVWLAQDEKLHRKVAIKILPPSVAANPERRSRFEREARAVAALNHPNIVTIYSVEESEGIHFITMELVAGKTLTASIPDNGMNLQRLLDAAIPLAEAVGAAHEVGIVHRDIKPDNVVVSDRGVLKVLDFGLAKLRDDSRPDITTAPTTLVTAEGRVMGTVAYMSPEQAEGKPIDPRSDVFSLGVTLYQMATGKRPFIGETSLSTLTAILRDTPAPIAAQNPGLPDDMSHIIGKCLAKAPADRYASAQDLGRELIGLREASLTTSRPKLVLERSPGSASSAAKRRTVLVALGIVALLLAITIGRVVLGPPGSGSGAPEESAAQDAPPVPRPPVSPGAHAPLPAPGAATARIVVLPFKNLGLPEDSYFAAGVTEEITSRLAGVAGLAVISATSAMRYADSNASVEQIGDDLDVTHVLEGTVRWDKGGTDGGRVRVTPRLIRAQDDTQVWTDRYDRAMEGIFEVQSEIASRVVDQLGVSLGAAAQRTIDAMPTRNMEAYQEYLKGKRLMASSLQQDIPGAIEHLERAVARDPSFAPAWAELSQGHTLLRFSNMDLSEERLVRAREAADKALALGRDLAEPLVALGYYYYQGRRDYEQALATFERAAEGRPPRADVMYAVGLIKRRQGKWDEAVEAMEGAFRLDPTNPDILLNLWLVHLHMRNTERTAAMCPRFRPLGDEPYALCRMNSFGARGDFDGAWEILSPFAGTGSVLTHEALWHIAVSRGRYDDALKVALSRPADSNSFQMPPKDLVLGWTYGLLGRKDEARAAYERAAAHLAAKLRGGADPDSRAWLSQAYAGLDRKEDAYREAQLAVDMVTMTRDALGAPDYLDNLARVMAIFGDDDRALDLVDQVLSVPSPIDVAIVEHHPFYAPLRDHPRYREILRKHRRPTRPR